MLSVILTNTNVSQLQTACLLHIYVKLDLISYRADSHMTNMSRHIKNFHSNAPVRQQRQQHRSKQITAEDNKKTKRLQMRHLIKSKQSFNSQEKANRIKNGLADLITHTSKLQEKTVGMFVC